MFRFIFILSILTLTGCSTNLSSMEETWESVEVFDKTDVLNSITGTASSVEKSSVSTCKIKLHRKQDDLWQGQFKLFVKYTDDEEEKLSGNFQQIKEGHIYLKPNSTSAIFLYRDTNKLILSSEGTIIIFKKSN